MAAHKSNDSLSAEERVFSALLNDSPLSECEGILGEVEEVDARGVRGRTMLHVAVRAGKEEWVDRLLQMGADPGVRDAEGDDVMRVAEALATKDNNRGARMEALKLVRVVHKHNSARNRYQSTMISDDRMSREMVSLRATNADLKRKLESRESSVELKRALESRDAVLIALQSGVTSLVGKVASLEGVGRGPGQREGMAEGGAAGERVDAGERDCVESMLRITTILGKNFKRETFVESIYRRIYSASPLTAAILRFLLKQSGVSVHIDCSSGSIGTMKGKVKDRDGVEKHGSQFESFADFSEKRVYVAGGETIKPRTHYESVTVHEMSSKCAGRIVGALFQLALYIAFMNGGQPYAESDAVNRRRVEDLLKKAVEENKTNGDINSILKVALNKETRLELELCLLSAVPRMILDYGSNSTETSSQRRIFPLLFEYVEGHVMGTLQSVVCPQCSRS